MLSGFKTYIVGSVGVVFAIIGVLMGFIDTVQAGEIFLASLGLMTLRAGIAKR
jgi:hypothetical protein